MYDVFLDQLERVEAFISGPWALVSNILSLAGTALVFVFMHYSAKNRNHKLSNGWYICGFLFPLLTAIAFYRKRKTFNGEEVKLCPTCGKRCSADLEACPECETPLPEISDEEKQKNLKIEKITGYAFWATRLTQIVGAAIMLAVTLIPLFQLYGQLTEEVDTIDERISLTDEGGNKVFYDSKGNAYLGSDSVAIYDKKGNRYTYSEEYIVEHEDALVDEGPCYVSEDGENFEYDLVYVDENGWFVYDEKNEFRRSDEFNKMLMGDDFYYDEASDQFFYHDGGIVSEEDITAHMYNVFLNYRYYEMPYYDEDGAAYYHASEASWNEKGELITAENDPTVE